MLGAGALLCVGCFCGQLLLSSAGLPQPSQPCRSWHSLEEESPCHLKASSGVPVFPDLQLLPRKIESHLPTCTISGCSLPVPCNHSQCPGGGDYCRISRNRFYILGRLQSHCLGPRTFENYYVTLSPILFYSREMQCG